MQENLVKIKNNLTGIYIIIMTIVVLGSLGLSSVFAINEAIHRWLSNLDRTAQILSDNIKREDLFAIETKEERFIEISSLEGEFTKEEYYLMNQLMEDRLVEKRLDDSTKEKKKVNFQKLEDLAQRIIGQQNYIMYAINSDGEFSILRKGFSGEALLHWENYQNKIIYEMLKEGNGWIVYPKKERWEVHKTQNVIKYFTDSDLGLIICLEGVRASVIDIFKGHLSFSTLGIILLLMFLSLVVFRIIIKRYLMKVESEIPIKEEFEIEYPKNSDFSIEPSMAGQFGMQDIILDEPQESKEQVQQEVPPLREEKQVEKSMTKEDQEEKLMELSSLIAKKMSEEQSDQKLKIEEDIQPAKQSELVEENIAEVNQEEVVGHQSNYNNETSQVEAENNMADERTSLYEGKKLNLRDVKSPLLRKLLEEIRNPK